MTIRVRLALWYGLAITATIAVLGTIVWIRYTADLRGALQEALAVQVADAMAGLAPGDKSNALREDPARPGIFTVVLDRTGRVVLASVSAPAGLGPVPPGNSTRLVPGATSSVALYAEVASDGRTIVAGSSLAPIDADAMRLAGLLALAGITAVVMSIVGGRWLAQRALAPVTKLVAEADRVHAVDGPHGRRLVAVNTRDELGQLASTFNRMLERVDRSVQDQRAFVAAASHDLRTPIAAMRTELELARRPGASADELRTAIEEALGDVRRLGTLADGLLGLAAADEAGRVPELEPVGLRALVGEVVRMATGADADWEFPLDLDVEDRTVLTDRVRVSQALGNLLANALRHGPAGAEVTIRARLVAELGAGGVRAESLDVDVLDRGPGIPASDVDSLFVPFARPRGAQVGTRLGLATAAAAVRALGGRIGYRDRPGGGAWFWFHVPTADAGPSLDPPARLAPDAPLRGDPS